MTSRCRGLIVCVLWAALLAVVSRAASQASSPTAVLVGAGDIASCSSTGNEATAALLDRIDRKSTRLNSSHDQISYAVFCLKKKKNHQAHRSTASYRYAHPTRAHSSSYPRALGPVAGDRRTNPLRHSAPHARQSRVTSAAGRYAPT